MDDTILTETTNDKHLGSTSLTHSHGQNTLKKRSRKLHGLKRHTCIAFIRPLLEYSESVWDNCMSESKKQLDLIHHEANRIITGTTKLCSIENLFADLGWVSLQERRSMNKFTIFYKLLNGLTPRYLSEVLLPLVQDSYPYNLRNANAFHPMHANTNLFFFFFFFFFFFKLLLTFFFLPFYYMSIALNALSEEIKQTNTVSAFKYGLDRNKRSPPKCYDVGTRIGQILHVRIHMECSSLNLHLFSQKCSC